MTNFEEQERTSKEIKFLFFKTFYLWTATYVSRVMISYSNFLILFALVKCFLLYTYCVLRSTLRF
jgi:hypothetical protein